MSNPTQVVCPNCGGLNRVPSDKLASAPLCGKCRSNLIVNKPIEASDSSFGRFIEKSELPVVVDCWATWCGPCQQFAPIFTEVASEEASKAVFIKLETDANPHTSSQLQIRSIPTLLVFRGGKEIGRLSGALPKSQFKQWLSQYL